MLLAGPGLGGWCHGVSIMPHSEAPDHDQHLKDLIKEFFHAFFVCFFPDWAARFEFVDIDWLDKELFLAPPQGERRQLDLVALLKLRPGGPPPRAGATDLVALVYLELESRASALAFRPRMFEYYIQLRRDTGLPVLPIALFLRVGLDGIGWDAYEEHFCASDRPLRLRLRRPVGLGRRAVRDGREPAGGGAEPP